MCVPKTNQKGNIADDRHECYLFISFTRQTSGSPRKVAMLPRGRLEVWRG